MTTDRKTASLTLAPFLVRFAEPMERAALQQVRYDESRQIAQVYINSKWVDTPDALNHTMNSTRMTKVNAETTDDS